MGNEIGQLLTDLFVDIGFPQHWAVILKSIFLLGFLGGLSYWADRILRRVIVNIVGRIIRKTRNQYDDILLERQVFERLSHLAPALIFYFLLHFALGGELPELANYIRKGLILYMVVVFIMVIDAFLNALHDIYRHFPISRDRDITGYVQVVKIFFYFFGVLTFVSVIFNEELLKLLTGLGAMAAVLLLIFKDTILGFVASIQLSGNKMLKPGDWISMPSHGADGSVLEISLNTVKVQNWDKTIVTVPTYAMVSESFQNWKGMEESGGRRIKRSINIDMKSVKFCTQSMMEKFQRVELLQDYIDDHSVEGGYRKSTEGPSKAINGDHITNIGMFRKYLEFYLREHPRIHNDMTFLVRQLQPTEKGLPLEIYVFSNDQAWANYEAIQSDIFDHIMAIVPFFELRIFQNPTGEDFQYLKS